MTNSLAWWLVAGWMAFSACGHAQYVTNSLIPSNSIWRVWPGTSEASNPTNLWRNYDFDDSAWLALAEPLHYGTNSLGGDDELTTGTILSDMKGHYTTVFTRRTFVVTNASLIKQLTFRFNFDGGFQAWIGPAHPSMNAALNLAYNASATKDAEGSNYVYFYSGTAVLRDGTNVLAVQGVNYFATNEDYRLNVQLDAAWTTNPPLSVVAVLPLPGVLVTNLGQVAVTFARSVTGVRAWDLAVNGVPATWVTGTNASYTFGFTLPAVGGVQISWSPTNAIRDTNGNGMGGTAPGWTYTQQIQLPSVQSTTPLAGNLVSNLTQVTVVFDRGVTNVDPLDLLMNGVPALAVAGGLRAYTFAFLNPPVGPVQMSWDPLLEIRDTNGLPFIGTNQGWTYSFVDLIAPYITALSPPAGASLSRLTDVRVTFSEPVAGVDAGDLVRNGQPSTGVVGSGSGPYVFQFPELTNLGVVSFWWAPGHGIHDLAAAQNAFAGGSWTVTVDSSQTSPVIINEFLVGNVSTNGLKDEDGELQDWIELNNRGSNAVPLLGWSLTDAADVPDEWVFPDVTLPPGGYLVIFASAKDRRLVGGTNRLHTNFKLNPDGEYLGLFNADSPRQSMAAFSPQYPSQRSDYSYGLNPSNQWRYYAVPTPGRANGDSPITAALDPVHFSVERGFFSAPFPLILSDSDPAARLRYTTDGSIPNQNNGQDYTNVLTLSRTAVLRAAAFKTNMLPSLVQTHTYLFLDDVMRQSITNLSGDYTNLWVPFLPDYDMDARVVTNAAYGGNIKSQMMALPSLSLVLKPGDMFSTTNGIYTHASASYVGPAWVRACSAELIYPDGSSGFQIDCGLKMQGGGSREESKEKKHPMVISFKSEFGASKLDYPVFPDSPVQEFDKLYLRSEYNNHWTHSDGTQRARGTMIRDQLCKDLMFQMGDVSTHATYVHLYINGLYWGVYSPCERPDGDFASAYLGGQSQDYDVFHAGNAGVAEAVNGDAVARNALLGLIASGPANPVVFEQIKQYLDLPQYIDYVLVQWYGANQDWDVIKNWYCFRRRAPGEGFKYMCWDSERTFEGVSDDRTSTSPDSLNTSLINSPEYKLTFADRVQKHLFNSGALTSNSLIRSWMARSALVDQAIVGESARWGDAWTNKAAISPYPSYNVNNPVYTREENFLGEQTRLITTYFPARAAALLSQLQTLGLYPRNVSAVTFSQMGGRVPAGFSLVLSATNGAIYYTADGADPRLAYSNTVAATALAYANPLVLNATAQIRARVMTGTNWGPMTEAIFTVQDLLPPLRFTEIMYNPIGGDTYEYVELKNLGTVPLDLIGYTLDGLTFVFASHTVVSGGAVIVLASSKSPTAFHNRYPGVNVTGWYAGHLDNGGQRLGLKDATGRTITSVHYDDHNGWPLAPDGGGYSLEVVDPNGNPDDPANWRASTVLNGSAGTVAPPLPASSVRLNEVMAANVAAVNHEGTYPDWVELANPSTNAADLSQWSLTDNDDPRRFVFPTGTLLPAGGYLVVWCDSATNITSGLHSDFGLNKDGETLFLYDAATNRVDAMSYGLQVFDYSVGWVGGSWQLTLPTPNAPNAGAPLAAATNLVINEWLPDALPGQDDWVELFNRAATLPVALQGLYLGTSNQTQRLQWLSFLGPLGYLEIHADQNAGPNHADFKLTNVNGGLMLYDPTGLLLDKVTYASTQQGVSQGRWPDGRTNIVQFNGSPSPGASNYVYAYTGPVLNEIMAVNHATITNGWGHTADWLELANPNAAPFDLSGMSLSDDPNQPGQWVFPAGSLSAANGFLVVWCDAHRPVSLGAEAQLNTGRALDGSSGGLWLFNALQQPVDSVVWGPQAADWSIGRTGGKWRLLAAPTPGATNATAAVLGNVTAVRINEWMAAPTSGNDWFELYNPQAQPVELSGLYLANSPALGSLTNSLIAPLSFIGPKGFTLWIADNDNTDHRDHVGFKLNDQGEAILLSSATLGVFDSVFYGMQQAGVSQGRWPDGSATVTNFPSSPTPGESNYQPLDGVVINEVLPRAAAPFEQALELFNVAINPVDLSGMYWSDSTAQLKKFRIPDGTVLPPGGFKVFFASQFNANPGTATNFALNPAGGVIYLAAADLAGEPNGLRAQVSYGAADGNISLGRVMTSAGVDFGALSQPSFGTNIPGSLAEFRSGLGATNAPPLIGPVVISEVMFHPPDIGGINNNTHDEFIELCNVGPTDVTLGEAGPPDQQWRLANAVDYTFPEGTVLPAASCLLVVGFDPSVAAEASAFRALYNVPAEVPLLGPWSGHLDNAGESLELSKPALPLPGGLVAQVLVDRVAYGPQFPWPLGADGGGASLQRTNLLAYGNEPLNWKADAPTAGQANFPVSGQPPVVRSTATNQTVLAGTAVSFAVTADGATPLSYQWRRAGLALSNATNASLSLPTVSAGDAGSYSVAVSNRYGGLLWTAGTLTVLTPPTITVPPASQSVVLGQPFSFSVTAVGDATLHYQWRRNGADLDHANTALFSLSLAQVGDAGDYVVVVANTAGSVTSAVATLTVLMPPQITSQPQSQTVEFGDPVGFQVSATGTPPLQYQWFCNNTPISQATNTTLTLPLPLPANSGSYAVQVSNGAGSVPSDPALLTVLTTRDSDHDGMTDYQEYLAGTDPHDSGSLLKLEFLSGTASANVHLRFNALAGHTYSVRWSDALQGAAWNTLTNVPSQAAHGAVDAYDLAPATHAQRFYRLISP